MGELIMLRLEDQILETLLRKALDGVVKKRILVMLLSFFPGLWFTKINEPSNRPQYVKSTFSIPFLNSLLNVKGDLQEPQSAWIPITQDLASLPDRRCSGPTDRYLPERYPPNEENHSLLDRLCTRLVIGVQLRCLEVAEKLP